MVNVKMLQREGHFGERAVRGLMMNSCGLSDS